MPFEAFQLLWSITNTFINQSALIHTADELAWSGATENRLERSTEHVGAAQSIAWLTGILCGQTSHRFNRRRKVLVPSDALFIELRQLGEIQRLSPVLS